MLYGGGPPNFSYGLIHFRLLIASCDNYVTEYLPVQVAASAKKCDQIRLFWYIIIIIIFFF